MAKVTRTTAISANAQNTNGATIVYGNAQNRGKTVTNSPGRTLVGSHVGTVNKVIAPLHERALNFTFKPLSAGTFAYNAKNNYIIRYVTRTISGVANTSVFMSPANRHRKSIAFNEHNNTRHYEETVINYNTGQRDKDPRVSVDNFAFQGTSTDVAARPTRTTPGHLFIMQGSKNAVTTKNYSGKTG